MLLATVNSGTLIIALPDLERSLHTTLLQLVWVILVYMIVSTVLVLTAGRLSDLFGRKTAYVLGFLVFSLASLGAGFAGSGTELILWRVLQGVGGAFLFANAAALVTDAFPKRELGLAMGTNTMVAAVGLVIGPVLGGALVAIRWPWVFWFNVPFGLVGCIWGLLVLEERSGRSKERGLDLARRDDVRRRPDRSRARALEGRPLRLDELARDRRTRGSSRSAPALRARRAPRHRADARPDALPRPAVHRRVGGRVPERALALRADVPVRLLLPGTARAVADHGRARARADGDRDAGLLADRRLLRRPARLARPRSGGHARQRTRARRDDDARGRTRRTCGAPSGLRSSASAPACSTARTRRR